MIFSSKPGLVTGLFPCAKDSLLFSTNFPTQQFKKRLPSLETGCFGKKTLRALKFSGFKTQFTSRDHYYTRYDKRVKTPCFHSAQSVTNFFSFLFSTVSRWSNADSSKVPLIGILITIAVGCAVIALFTTVCLVVVCKRKVGMQKKTIYSFLSNRCDEVTLILC